LGDEASKGLGIGFGEFGEHFGIYFKALFVGRAYKFGVGKFSVYLAQGRVDADVPEALKVVLFVAAVGKGVLARVEYRLARLALLCRAAVAVAPGLCQDIFAALI